MSAAPLFDWTPPPICPDGIPHDVCLLFERLAKDLWIRGFERFSADAILHQIRWSNLVERGDRGFKADNNWSAPLARWFMARNPSCGKFFELRERISA